ncbi:MAG: hypothetical protein DDG60_02905 [Anaerolineae bacterium]|nr:MAG: hypothetical protein DDG60_02905 [Anaerolineae bacterium]
MLFVGRDVPLLLGLVERVFLVRVALGGGAMWCFWVIGVLSRVLFGSFSNVSCPQGYFLILTKHLLSDTLFFGHGLTRKTRNFSRFFAKYACVDLKLYGG